MESKNIVLPIHCSGENNQIEKARKLEKLFNVLGHKVSLVNLDGSDNELVIQEYIRQQKPEMLVTIDCAGFDLKLLGDDLFYNSLCVPAMHFLTKPLEELKDKLNERMNFTMTFYVDNMEDKQLLEREYFKVPRVVCMEKLFTKGMIAEYMSSEQIIEQINALPQVFASLFMSAVECKEKNRDLKESQVLDICLKDIGFDATDEEKQELITFMNIAFTYYLVSEFEEQAGYLSDELEFIF